MLLTARTPSRYASAGRAFCLYGGLAAAVKFYRRRHDHPAIQQSLGGSPAALSWLTNGFMLTFGSFCWPQG